MRRNRLLVVRVQVIVLLIVSATSRIDTDGLSMRNLREESTSLLLDRSRRMMKLGHISSRTLRLMLRRPKGDDSMKAIVGRFVAGSVVEWRVGKKWRQAYVVRDYGDYLRVRGVFTNRVYRLNKSKLPNKGVTGAGGVP